MSIYIFQLKTANSQANKDGEESAQQEQSRMTDNVWHTRLFIGPATSLHMTENN